MVDGILRDGIATREHASAVFQLWPIAAPAVVTVRVDLNTAVSIPTDSYDTIDRGLLVEAKHLGAGVRLQQWTPMHAGDGEQRVAYHAPSLAFFCLRQ